MCTKRTMTTTNYDKQIGIRIAEPVYRHLKDLAAAEDLKVADIIRRAIREFISSECAPKESN